MNSSWKARIILAIGIAVIVFGDYFGYGNNNTSTLGNNNNSNRHTEQTQNIIEQRTPGIKEGSTNGKVEGSLQCFFFVYFCNAE